MPCYTAWNAYLRPDSPEYPRAEQEVRAKLLSIKHIIDYYYSVSSFSLPDLPDGTSIDFSRQPKSRAEQYIRSAICHHFACDQVSVSNLLDASTLLDDRRNEDRRYLAVILPCTTLLRETPEKYRTVY